MVMAGGDADPLERFRLVVETVTSEVIRWGDVGTGIVLKLVYNILVLTHTMSTMERSFLGVKAGIGTHPGKRLSPYTGRADVS